MPRTSEPFDVETLEGGKAVNEPFDVGDKTVMRDVLRDGSRFPGVVFERYRFPAESGTAPPSKPESPFVIVSFTGRNCVVHRVNKGGSRTWGNKGLTGLWGLVEHHLAGRDGLRVWTESVPHRKVKRFLSRQAGENPEGAAESGKIIRKISAWRQFLERKGFSPRRRGGSKTTTNNQTSTPYARAVITASAVEEA